QPAFPVPRSVRRTRQQPQLPEARAQHDRPAGTGAAERRRRDRGGEGAGGSRDAGGANGGRARRAGVPAGAGPSAVGGGIEVGARVPARVAAERIVPGAVQRERVHLPGLSNRVRFRNRTPSERRRTMQGAEFTGRILTSGAVEIPTEVWRELRLRP